MVAIMKIFGFKRELLKTKITILGIKFSIKHDYRKKVSVNYARKLTELQKEFGKRKIKVGFLVNEPAKWQYQSLYEEMEKSDYFEPVVLVTQLLMQHKRKKNFYKNIEECYQFFSSKNIKARYAYDIQKKIYLSPDKFDVDILFYPQPYEIAKVQHPAVVSKFMLTCYVPYGMHLVDYSNSYTDWFHLWLWLMFMENNYQVESSSKIIKQKINNYSIVGYPKLDAYHDTECSCVKKHNKPVIIYAPHHSFEKEGLSCATFQYNGKDILSLAKKYRNKINWVFKPHPRFKTAVISNGIMSEQEINEYYEAWEKLGMIHDTGNYIDLFKSSEGMITDCVSFLGEYLPSGNPLFHLLGKHQPFNSFAESFINAYYKIFTIQDLEASLLKVIIEQKDDLRQSRLSKIPIVFDDKEKAAEKIMAELIQKLRTPIQSET